MQEVGFSTGIDEIHVFEPTNLGRDLQDLDDLCH